MSNRTPDCWDVENHFKHSNNQTSYDQITPKSFTYRCEQIVHITLSTFMQLYLYESFVRIRLKAAKSNENNCMYVCVWWIHVVSSCRSNKQGK